MRARSSLKVSTSRPVICGACSSGIGGGGGGRDPSSSSMAALSYSSLSFLLKNFMVEGYFVLFQVTSLLLLTFYFQKRDFDFEKSPMKDICIWGHICSFQTYVSAVVGSEFLTVCVRTAAACEVFFACWVEGIFGNKLGHGDENPHQETPGVKAN